MSDPLLISKPIKTYIISKNSTNTRTSLFINNLYFFKISMQSIGSVTSIGFMFKPSAFKFYKVLLNHILPLFSFFFTNIIFVGKGYKLTRSSTNNLLFGFGHSHFLLTYFGSTLSSKISKNKFLFVGLNFFLLRSEISSFYKFKPLNIFTWRGLKLKNSTKRKKVGKVSLYF